MEEVQTESGLIVPASAVPEVEKKIEHWEVYETPVMAHMGQIFDRHQLEWGVRCSLCHEGCAFSNNGKAYLLTCKCRVQHVPIMKKNVLKAQRRASKAAQRS